MDPQMITEVASYGSGVGYGASSIIGGLITLASQWIISKLKANTDKDSVMWERTITRLDALEAENQKLRNRYHDLFQRNCILEAKGIKHDTE